MKAAQIRSEFLKFFEKNGHTRVESSSLIPANDPTLLFTNAGMVQFKDVFLGKDPRPYKRATTSQKCVRAGGKHNDLENVGFTARHHTFFEMLGNFSFGDYFKKEAIRFAWEFVTQVLKLPKDRLYVTVFEKDDEAAEIWEKQEGVPRDRIYRFGEKDNFWAMGDTGPCGPCTEIFIDRGAKYSCGKPTCKMGCDCDRYMEFWNLVFMQYERDASGKLTPLPKPSVDTGAGLERIASILQDVETNYDTDLFQDIIGKISKLVGVSPGPTGPHTVPFRIIADHARATTFLIGDGVMPSNEGRGYVLRRIMRRAIRYTRRFEGNKPTFYKTIGFVIDQMKDAYPDLVEKQAFIEKAALAEEEQFLRTLERGLELLDDEIKKLGNQKTLPGDVAFKLYDTYGFPIDLTRILCAEKGVSVDEAGFEKGMERQRTESRKHWKGSGEEALSAVYQQTAAKLRDAKQLPQFVGYEKGEAQGKCLWILQDGKEISSVTAPAEVEALFQTTPFYGESGGQVGDRGRVTGSGLEALVTDVQRPVPELIVAKLKLTSGSLKIGTAYNQEVDASIRALTAANHTATHLLHWALREVLGKHVKQAGSLVTPELLRFDFAHFQALTEAELKQIEDLINAKIWAAERVSKEEMTKDQATSKGAIAFFGEKYGDRVRVVSVGGYSVELCGGTHVDNSGDIHLFKIGSESGIAAGVRRIIAYTARGAFEHLRKRDEEIKRLRDMVKASSSDEIPTKIERMQAAEKDLRKQIEQMNAEKARDAAKNLTQNKMAVGSTFALVEMTAMPIAQLRELTDTMKASHPDWAFFFGAREDGKAGLVASLGPKFPKDLGLNASEIIKTVAPIFDGKGGGKPDHAQASGTNPAKLEEALEQIRKMIRK